MIRNDLPQHMSVQWTGTDSGGNLVLVTPDSVDWSVSDAALGTVTPDVGNETGGAIFVANPGAVGPVSFGATSHQAGLLDFQAAPATDNLVNPPPPQINGGAVILDPQGAALARGMRRR